jgi:DNA-binding NarL/FixJ family response regulator
MPPMSGSRAPTAQFTRRLLIVEDDPFVATLLADILRRDGFDVRIASDVLAARRLVDRFDPDIALLDIGLGAGPTGLDLAHYLDREHPGIGILFLTRHPDRRSAGLAAADVPARAGFLRKDMVGDTGALNDAIAAVLRDNPQAHRHDLDTARPLSGLTARQVEVLRLAALGLTNAAIAVERGTTERAVELLLQSALKALDVPDDPSVNRRVEGVRRYVDAVGLPHRAERTPRKRSGVRGDRPEGRDA